MSCALGYFKVITSNEMVKQEGYKQIKKTLMERLTWRFWEATKLVPNMVPRKDFLVIDKDRTIICHPIMRDALEDHIESLI